MKNETYFIHQFIQNNRVIISNYYYKDYECDVFAITKSNYTVEYEFKISVADFRKDAQKQRRWLLNTKHQDILAGKRTNRFYFVVPEEIEKIVLKEAPEGFGVITFKKDKIQNSFTKVRHSKLFHKKEATEDIYFTLARKMAWRLYKKDWKVMNEKLERELKQYL